MARVAVGGLVLGAVPSRAEIDDSQACELPEDLLPWRDVSISCFKLDGWPTPVLDLPILFSARDLPGRSASV